MASKNLQGIVIKIGGDTTELGKALNKINQSSRSLQTELNNVNRLLKLDPTNVNLLKQKQDLLTESINKTKEKLKLLKDAQEEMTKKFNKYKDVANDIKSVSLEIDNTKKELEKLKIQQDKAKEAFEAGEIGKEKYEEISGAVSECEKKLKQLNQQQKELSSETVSPEQYREFQRQISETEIKLKKLKNEQNSFTLEGNENLGQLSKKLKNVGGSVEELGKKFKVTSALASAGIFASVKAAIDFESAFAGVKKTVDGTDEELLAIKDGLIKMSEQLPSSKEDLASVAEAAGQLGIKTENILDFTKVMVDLGESTNLSSTEAASSLAKFANVTKMSAEDYSKLGSVIVALGNNFATTENDIVSMATRLAATGELTGLSESQIMALATAMSSVGIEAEAGGSAMSKLLKQIQLAVETGSEDLTKFASVANMSSEEFKIAFEEDAVEALSSFISGLNDTERNGKTAVAILDDMGIKETRLSNTILSLASSGNLMTDTIKLANKSWEENTALTDEANKRYETSESKLNMIKNQISNLTASIGETLLPLFRDILEKISEWLNKFNSLDSGIKKVISTVLLLVAGLSPVITIIGKVISAFGTIINVFNKVIGVIKLLKPAFVALNAVMSANPIALIIIAITALIAIFVTLWNKCEWFRNFWIDLWNNIKAILEPIIIAIGQYFLNLWESIKAIWDFAQPYFLALWEGIKAIFEPLIEYWSAIFQSAWNAIKLIWDNVTGYFQAIWDTIKGIFDVVTAVFSGDFQGAWDAIVGIVDTWKEYFSGVWEGIKSVFEPLINWFSDTFGGAWNAIVNIFSGIGNWFGEKFNEAYTNIKNVFSGIGNFFGGLWNTIKDKFSSLGTTIGDAMGSAVKSGINGIISIIENTINKAIGLINGAIDLVNNIPGVSVGKISNVNLPRLASGSVLKKPTAFIGGEYPGASRNPEIVSPRSTMEESFNKVLTRFFYNKENNKNVQIPYDNRIYEILDKFLPGIYGNSNKKICLDSGALVGELASGIDSKLGEIKSRKGRGN